tara:strand:- start:2577 stop:3290 length:714 start_codon:yes stop_codon:yes gene_type:complete
MKPEFIYFDLDNTLIDHTDAEAEAHQIIHSQFPELREVPVEDWLNTYKTINHALWLSYQKGAVDRYELQRTRFKASMDQLGIPSERSEEIGSEYMQAYRTCWKWIDGAEEALSNVAESYPVGFITNGFSETQQKKFEFLNLDRFSNLFIISEDVGVMKPHPKVFDVATDRSAVARDRIVYVGDSYSSDIIGGRNAGWKTAWYTAFVDQVESDQIADFHFDQFPELVRYLNGSGMDEK